MGHLKPFVATFTIKKDAIIVDLSAFSSQIESGREIIFSGASIWRQRFSEGRTRCSLSLEQAGVGCGLFFNLP
jgi:hypothetical protein